MTCGYYWTLLDFIGYEFGDPTGNRTPVSGVRGQDTIGSTIPQRPANKRVKGATTHP